MRRYFLIFALASGCLIPDSLIRQALDRDRDGEKALGDHGEFGIGTDCDDTNPRVGATHEEVCEDGLDNDCDGLVDGPSPLGRPWFVDRDGDGHASISRPLWACLKPEGAYFANPADCDDANAGVHPEAEEVCNGLDDNCDRQIDEQGDAIRWFADADGDGYGDPEVWVDACQRPPGHLQSGTDCDDGNAGIHPGADERWYDGIDQDCQGGDDHDADGDGARHPSAWQGPAPADALVDCDDTSARIWPGAPEVWYDGIDQDCDPDTEWDADGDGLTRLGAPAGSAIDCDDAQAAVGGPTPWYLDGDGDGFGDLTSGLLSCSPLPGRIAEGRDCHDADPLIHPDAAEVCGRVDDDCDGLIDEGAGGSWWPDADGDGHGDGDAAVVTACFRPDGYVTNGTDCADDNPDAFLGAVEVCDGADNNCNNLIDDVLEPLYWPDADGDGHGDATITPIPTCAPEADWVTRGGDCNDGEPDVHPARPEVCNYIDDNCNALVDDVSQPVYWPDDDLDGHGDGSRAARPLCFPPGGWSRTDDDCDDTNADRAPSLAEWCDDLDNDCDLLVDEGVLLSWWPDGDGDGFGDDGGQSELACAPPSGWVGNRTDCDDSDIDVHPGPPETLCDSVDNNCDGVVDDLLRETFYVDGDRDGHGRLGTAGAIERCSRPTGYSATHDDCDDADDRIAPGESELTQGPTMCDGLDNDCDPDTPADPPEACGADTLSVVALGSRYLLRHQTDTWPRTLAEDWCENNGYHLWWVADQDQGEPFWVFHAFRETQLNNFTLNPHQKRFHVGVQNHCPSAMGGVCNAAPTPVCLPQHYWHWYDPIGNVCDWAYPDLQPGFPVYDTEERFIRAQLIDTTPTDNTVFVYIPTWEIVPFTASALTLCERELP